MCCSTYPSNITQEQITRTTNPVDDWALEKPSRTARVQGARSGRFRHPASRDTCTSMCGAGTAVYMRVHEDSEHRATQQSGRAAGFKRFPKVTNRVAHATLGADGEHATWL